MALLPDTEGVVSIDEIEDYFATRGAWTGKGFQLASTAAKRAAVRRRFWSGWLMRAGWTTLVLLALPPLSIVEDRRICSTNAEIVVLKWTRASTSLTPACAQGAVSRRTKNRSPSGRRSKSWLETQKPRCGPARISSPETLR